MLSKRFSVKPVGSYYVLNMLGKLPLLQLKYVTRTQNSKKTFKNRPKIGALTEIVLESVWPPKSSENRPSINPALIGNLVLFLPCLFYQGVLKLPDFYGMHESCIQTLLWSVCRLNHMGQSFDEFVNR